MKGDGAVLDRIKALSKSDVFVPQPVLAEIAYGIERLPRSKRRESLQDRFELVRAELQRIE
jgi:predicted nucleic acid-binding protein